MALLSREMNYRSTWYFDFIFKLWSEPRPQHANKVKLQYMQFPKKFFKNKYKDYSPLKQFFIVWSPIFLQFASYRLFKCTTYRTNAQFSINNLKSNCHRYIIFHKILSKLLISLQLGRGQFLILLLWKTSLYVIIISINTYTTNNTNFPYKNPYKSSYFFRVINDSTKKVGKLNMQ